jgi:hypothetical protein
MVRGGWSMVAGLARCRTILGTVALAGRALSRWPHRGKTAWRLLVPMHRRARLCRSVIGTGRRVADFAARAVMAG